MIDLMTVIEICMAYIYMHACISVLCLEEYNVMIVTEI